MTTDNVPAGGALSREPEVAQTTDPSPPMGVQKSESGANPAPASFRRAFANLSLLVLLGVAISAWILAYTDWFPVVGGLLGLGGLFAWIAFVSGLLTNERKEQLQERFDTLVLQRDGTWIGVLVVGLLFVLWASRHGTIVLRSHSDERDRTVKIVPVAKGGQGKGRVYQGHIDPYSIQKYLVLTGWSRASYRVKLSGLPSATAEVGPMGWEPLASPGSFLERPIVLIRPTAEVSANAERFPMTLKVSRKVSSGWEVWTIPAESNRGEVVYRGEAVWFGCEPEVEIPERFVNRWRLELRSQGTPEEVLYRWMSPLALAKNVILKGNEQIQAELLREGAVHASGKKEGGGLVEEIIVRRVVAATVPATTGAENPKEENSDADKSPG